jgi:hypothetical protein
MRSVTVVWFVILMVLTSMELLASEDNDLNQSDTSQLVVEDPPQEFIPSDTDPYVDQNEPPEPDNSSQPSEFGDQFQSGMFRGSVDRGSRGNNQSMPFGLRRGPGSTPFRSSIQLGGYFGNDSRFMSGSASLNWNKRKFSLQSSVNYQIDWSKQNFKVSSQRQQIGNQDNQQQDLPLPGNTNPNQDFTPNISITPSSFETSSNQNQMLNLGTRLDYPLGSFFLFGQTSLRIDTTSLNRTSIGTGVGHDLPKNAKLDIGFGLTRFFGEYVAADKQGYLVTQNTTESEVGNTATLFSTLEWRTRLSSLINLDLSETTYWYMQENKASAELKIGTNLRVTRSLFLRTSASMDYLSLERSESPFGYQIQASLVYSFGGPPR